MSSIFVEKPFCVVSARDGVTSSVRADKRKWYATAAEAANAAAEKLHKSRGSDAEFYVVQAVAHVKHAPSPVEVRTVNDRQPFPFLSD
jgi:hypothetical protein